MSDDNRQTEWLISLAREVLPSWPEERRAIDVEAAVEWLWLCTEVLDACTAGSVPPSQAEEVAERALKACEEVQQRLSQFGFDEHLQEQRLREISGR
jgi:hypothetical protein